MPKLGQRIRLLTKRALLSLLALLILVTLLPIFESDEWWIRLWDFPRLQIAALVLVTLVVLVLIGPRSGQAFWIGIGAGLFALGWQLWRVAPYLPGWPVAVESAETCAPGNDVTLLNANVLATNRDYGAVLDLVGRTDPDVVLLLETDRSWIQAMRPLHVRYPYRVGVPLPNTYGMMLLSKLPLENAQVRHLFKPHVPSIKAGLRLRSDEIITFYGVHPEPPRPGNDSGERDAELVLVGREVRAGGRAAIAMGDLNDVGWSKTSRLFRRLAGMGDPRVGRGPYPTFPASMPILAWPLDHAFVTPHFELMRIDRLRDIGSDHWPMLFGLCLKREADERIVPNGVSEEVREDARDQVDDGREERAGGNRG